MPKDLRHGQRLELEGIAYRLSVNPRARRYGVRIDAGRREAVVVAPHTRHLGAALAFARSRSAWIGRHLGETQAASIAFAPGAVIPFEGRPTTLTSEPGRRAARLAGPDVIVAGGEGEAFSRRIEAFLRTKARARLGDCTARHAARLGQPVPKVSLGDAGGRWGSCSPQRASIRYSWRLIMAPPEVLDYVAAHEVAHLIHPHHQPSFWAEVERLYGPWQDARAWLRREGARLHAVGR